MAVSVFPVADLTSRIVEGRWQVVTMLPPGHSPHDYTIRPSAAAGLSAAKVLIAVGPGLDDWAIRAGRAASGQRDVLVLTETLQVNDGTPQSQPADQHDDSHVSEGASHEQDDHHLHGDDPHLWLDPILTQRIVEQIGAVLVRHDPAGREIYERNVSNLKRELAALDEEYRATLTKCRTKTLIVFHPGYGYLVRRYGLQQVALVGLGGVTPGRLEQVVQRIQQEHISAIYREPQYESKWVSVLSERTGAKVLVLDPLGHPGRPGYDSYFAMMRSNLAALKGGLDHGS